MADNLPIEIIQKIKDYIPLDKNMFSPTSICMKHLITYYNHSRTNADYWLVDPSYKERFPPASTYYFCFYEHTFSSLLITK